MNYPDPKSFLVVFLLEAISGLSFIMFICLSAAGTKSNRITTFNKILMALVASNMCYTFTMSANYLLSYFLPHVYKITYVTYILYYMLMYSVTSICWLSSTLCIFYFLKIIPSQPPILAKVKNMTGTIAGGLLLVAEVVSLSASFLPIFIANQNPIQINSSESRGEKLEHPMTVRVTVNDIIVAVNCLPIFFIILTMVISALLLHHYNGRMKKNIASIKANVKDYRTAVQTMTGLLIFYTLTFLIVILNTLKIIDEKTWGFWISDMLLFLYPTVQSAFLIYGNPKMKETLRKKFTFVTQTIGSWQ